MVALVLVPLTPLLVGLAALVVALLAGLAYLTLARGARTREWVRAFFRRPARPGQAPDRDHYYRPYWTSPSAS